MTYSETNKQKLHEKLIKEFNELGIPFRASDNISHRINDADREQLTKEVEEACKNLLRALVIDETDYNIKETAKRMSKMYIGEVFKGRYEPKPKVTFFPNFRRMHEIYVLGPIAIRSCCSHHFVPIIGQLHVGIIPNEKLIGISKIVRIAEWYLNRPHIQEEAMDQLADELQFTLEPQGLALVFKAQHFCMHWRGVQQEHTQMTSSIMRGIFKHDLNARQEFLQLIKKE